MLVPQDSETREVRDLCGIWRFRLDPAHQGRDQDWAASPLRDTIPMPAPSSFNEIIQDPSVRYHIGDA